jgi:predicted DNA binding CopG/RHH family protein
MKLTKAEQEIEVLYKAGRIAVAQPRKAALKKIANAADNTFRKDRRINIRLSEHDMVGIQRVAASKGVPYQTLISGLIHQFISGDLIQKA